MTWVLFFDGECALCRQSVRWVARWDRRGRIFFAPLQGELARQNGLAHYADAAGGSLVVVREAGGCVFTRSDALMELARALGGGWRALCLLRAVPKCLRDAIYRWVACNRHHFSSRSDRCAVPDLEWLKRLRK